LFGLVFDDLNYLVLTGNISGFFVTKVNPAGITGDSYDFPFPEKQVETPAMAYGKGGISLIAYSYRPDTTSEKEIKTMIFNSHPADIKVNKNDFIGLSIDNWSGANTI
jgi:hypothetical protein